MPRAGLHRADPPLCTGAWAVYPWSAAEERRYRVQSRFGEVMSMARRHGQHLLVPRALCPVAADDRRAIGMPIKLPHISLRPDQGPLVDQGADLMAAGQSFQLKAPTGKGKTVMALEMIARVGRKTLVIVHKEDLLDGWYREIQKHLGLGPKDVGIIQGDRYAIAGRPIVLGMLKSLAIPGRYPAQLRDEFGLVVWDEVHKVNATTFSETLGLFSARLRLGLSATPERADGKEILANAHIGPIRVSTGKRDLTPRVALYRTTWRCPGYPDRMTGDWKQIRHGAGKCGHIINRLVKDDVRNAWLARLIALGHARGRTSIVFSDRKAHLENLRARMQMNHRVPEVDIADYISGLSKAEREKALHQRIVLATYQMGDTGTDAPGLDACFLGTPRADVDQIVGRVLRPVPGKEQPVVVDPMDNDSPVFRGYSQKRLDWYRSIGAPVVEYAYP